MVNNREFIISLTTWNKRIQMLKKTLESLISQKTKADRIVVNIAFEEFPTIESIPEDVMGFIKANNIELYYVRNNIKAMKKIIPTLLRYKNAYVITADDDIIYPNDWVEKHIQMFKKCNYKTPTSCNRCYKFNASGGHGSIFCYDDIANTYHLFEDSVLFACNQDDLIYGLMVSANKKNFTHFNYQVPHANDVKGMSASEIDHKYNIKRVNEYLIENFNLTLDELRSHNFEELKIKSTETIDNYFQSYTFDEVSEIEDKTEKIKQGKSKFLKKGDMQKTKVVYTLTSDGTDNYLEELMLSIYSLRKYNNVSVVILIDKETERNLKSGRDKIRKYGNVISVETPKGLTKIERSRYLKINCRNLIDGDFLYIDSDTVITGSLDGIDNTNRDILMCAENEYGRIEEAIISTLQKIGCKNQYKYYNSGVIYCKDNEVTRGFYKKWYENWNETRKLLGTHKDQYPLAKTNDTNNLIGDIGKEYNVMIYMTKDTTNAKIIHYWGNTKKIGKSTFLKIRRNGYNVTNKEYDDVMNEIKKSNVCDIRNKRKTATVTQKKRISLIDKKDINMWHQDFLR